jgi:hypothetical protein
MTFCKEPFCGIYVNAEKLFYDKQKFACFELWKESISYGRKLNIENFIVKHIFQFIWMKSESNTRIPMSWVRISHTGIFPLRQSPAAGLA